MRVVLYSNKGKQVLELPVNIEGSFVLSDDNQNKMININSIQNNWIMSANPGFNIIKNGQSVEHTPISIHSFYLIKSDNESVNNYVLYAEPDYDNSIKVFSIEKNTSITIGKSSNNDIVYDNPYINDNHLILQRDDFNFILVVVNNGLTFLNDIALQKQQTFLYNGDVILLTGLRIVIVNNLIIINNPRSNVQIKTDKLKEVSVPYVQYSSNQENQTFLQKKEDYFFKKPRIRRYIKTIDIPVASPPQKHEQEDTPLLLVIGPMLTMGVISLVSIINTTIRIANGETTFADSWTTFVTAGVMLMAMLLWPILTRKYQKNKAKVQEERRVKKYREYISRKQIEIQNICNEQSEILKELYIPVDECCKIIET